MTPAAATSESAPAGAVTTVQSLRALAIRALARMYVPEERLFVFRLERAPSGEVVPAGRSRRYTAIALLGLAGEASAAVSEALHGQSPTQVCERLVDDAPSTENLGDVSLSLWAANAIGHARRGPLIARIEALRPADAPHPTVEVAWALAALSAEPSERTRALRDRTAARLMDAFGKEAPLAPHELGRARTGLRGHVTCFADLVYPIQALARFHAATRSERALALARASAAHMVAAQGPAGQWWWHYDARTGGVIEGFPVYAVHQHAMGPMCLFDLAEADPARPDFDATVAKSLAWLRSSPELGGRSLVDPAADLVWRKVARREPRKLARALQALASRAHPRLRVPGLDLALPAGSIDHESRPYEYGWLLYAFPAARAARMDTRRTP